MPVHLAHGVRIASDLRLWPDEAPGPATTADVSVVLRGGPPPPAAFGLDAGLSHFHVPGVVTLRVARDAVEVWRETDRDDVVSAYVSGVGLAMALTHRGAFVLHGGCVVVGGRAVCIAGASGAGKTTLGLALGRRGHTVLTDGMTALRWSGQTPVAPAGPRWAKVWPDSAIQLGLTHRKRQRVTDDHDKWLVPLDGTPPPEVPVSGVHVLAGPDSATRDDAPGRETMTLLRNSFLAEWLGERASPTLLGSVARVAAGLRVGWLTRDAGWERLSACVEAVEKAAGG